MKKLAEDFALLAKDGASAEQLMAAFGPRVDDLSKAAGGYQNLNIPQDFRNLADAVKQGGPAFQSLTDTLAAQVPKAAQGSAKGVSDAFKVAGGDMAGSLSGGFGRGIDDGVAYGKQVMDQWRRETEQVPIKIPVELVFPDGMGLGGR